MPQFFPFEMERWQSIYENRVACNLSESGVFPMTLNELADLSGTDLGDTRLGYGQSNGTSELREHIARLYPNTTAESVVVTNGSAEANFVALWDLIQPGDTIAVVVPTYMQTYGLAVNLGVRVREIPLHEHLGWQPDPAEIDAAIDAETRVVVITNPGNPTGSLLSTAARAALIGAAERVGAWILADEVYAGAELGGEPTPSFIGEYERVIATGSLSKAYGLPGLRIGWAVATPAVADRLWARKDYTTISTGELTDRAAALALDPATRPRILERTRRFLYDGLAIVEEWLKSEAVFSYTSPRAGAIIYAKYDLRIESAQLAERLRADHDLLIVPGSQFQMGRYVRIGFGGQTHELREGLARFSDYLKKARTLLF